jgi:DNA-binding NarL/FixJ family response regulator
MAITVLLADDHAIVRDRLRMVLQKQTGHAALSPRTVETCRSRLTRELELTSLPKVVRFAIQHGPTRLEG